MKTKLFSMALIFMMALIMVQCSKEETTDNEPQVNLTETGIGDYLFTGEAPGINLNNPKAGMTKTIKFFESEGPFEFDYNVEGCSPAPYLTVSGSGNASHLGLYTVVNQGCYDGVSPIFGVITAANGDEIHTYIAAADQDPNTGIWYYHYEIYNGTGNFEGAVGDIYMEGTLNFINFVWNLKGEGTITY